MRIKNLAPLGFIALSACSAIEVAGDTVGGVYRAGKFTVSTAYDTAKVGYNIATTAVETGVKIAKVTNQGTNLALDATETAIDFSIDMIEKIPPEWIQSEDQALSLAEQVQNKDQFISLLRKAANWYKESIRFKTKMDTMALSLFPG